MEDLFSNYAGPIFWTFIAILAAAAEGMTCSLVAIWFMPGALLTLLLSFFVKEAWILVSVFLVLSAVTMLFAKKVLKKFNIKNRENRTNIDALIGETAICTEAIDNLRETGSVKIHGLVWSARSGNGQDVIEAGTLVRIDGIRGVKLICVPVHQNEN